jgi:pimeloyl-ACP methyl ester carboxylesterase
MDGATSARIHAPSIRSSTNSTLLGKAGVKPPLVLVGHSYGGWRVRLYASTYREEVVGMVLVEAGPDNPRRVMADGKLVRSSTSRPDDRFPQ